MSSEFPQLFLMELIFSYVLKVLATVGIPPSDLGGCTLSDSHTRLISSLRKRNILVCLDSLGEELEHPRRQ